MPRYTLEQIVNPDALYESPSPSDQIYQRRKRAAHSAVNSAATQLVIAKIFTALAWVWIIIITFSLIVSSEVRKSMTSSPAALCVFVALLAGAMVVLALMPDFKRRRRETIVKATTPHELDALAADAATES